MESQARVRGRVGETLSAHILLPVVRLGLGQSPAARCGFAFIPIPTHVCPWKGAQIPRLLPPPSSPQAWLRSGAGCCESFSLNQYNLPLGSREQICSHLKAVSVFPTMRGFPGLSPNPERTTFRKQNKPRALGALGGLGRNPGVGGGAGGRLSGPGSGQAGGWTDGRAAQAKPARGLQTRSSCVYW